MSAMVGFGPDRFVRTLNGLSLMPQQSEILGRIGAIAGLFLFFTLCKI
jgi:hypothetical protein